MKTRDVVNLVIGATIGSVTTFGVCYVIARYKEKKTPPPKPESPARRTRQSSTSTYRRSQSTEEGGNERTTQSQRQFHRLLSTSGSTTQEDTPTITVEMGKSDETQNMMNLLYFIADEQAKRDGYVHRGITCNMCSLNPLCGTRYKCANCSDYDVCEKCEPKDVHNSTHVFLKITTPLPPLSSPRAMLTKKLYPGKPNNFNFLSLEETLKYTRETNFDQYEIEALHEEYRSLAKSERGISREVFDACLGPLALESNLLLERLFKFYDRNGDKYIDFDELVRGMSILVKGTVMDKMPYAFQGYDLDKRDSISKDNMRRLFKAYFDITIELVRDVVKACEEEMMANFDDSSGKPVSSLFSAPIPNDSAFPPNNNTVKRPIPGNPGGRESMWPVMEAMSQDAIEEMVDNLFKMANLGDDDRMVFEKFKEIALIDASLVAWFDALGTVF